MAEVRRIDEALWQKGRKEREGEGRREVEIVKGRERERVSDWLRDTKREFD